MFELGGAVCPTCSPWERTSGSAGCHAGSPFRRYETVTVALALLSPAIRHSNPSERSVGGSVQNAPGSVIVELCAVARVGCAYAAALSTDAAASTTAMRSEMVRIGADHKPSRISGSRASRHAAGI